MSLRINHNIDAIVGQRNLSMNSANLSHSLQRLSSGLRINSAADDPSGLVISEQMRAQITGLNQAVSNTQNAVSMVQTTEGALDEVNSLLDKARQLTLDAANTGVNDTNQLAADQSELDNVISSISRISSVTQFGTKNLLDGSLNGATNVSANISHVTVGNLANNAAISVGSVSLAVAGGAKENIVLKGAGTDSVIFSGTVSGVQMGTKKVLSGVAVTLTIGSGSVNYTTTGVMTATQLAAKLNTTAGYAVTANSGGSIKVSKSNYGAAAFTSSITFTKAATAATPGTKESITASLHVTPNSTATGAGGVIFNGLTAGKLSGVTTSTVVNCGATFGYTLKTATGYSYTSGVAVTVSGATQTMAQVLSGLKTKIQALNHGFSGATVSLVAGGISGGLQVKVSRGVDTLSTDFQFTLNIDYKNNATTKSQANLLTMAGTFQTGANSTFITSGGTSGVTAANINTGTKLAAGAAMELTISGQTITLTGNRSMTALATAFQSAIQALGGNLVNARVAFQGTGSTKYSGLTNAVGITGAITAHSFVVYNTDGKSLNVSLKVDQKQGLDVSIAGSSAKTGVQAGATLDLTTTAQTRTNNVATIAGVSGHTAASTTGASVVTHGGKPSAVMTTSNGVALNLVTSFTSTTGGILLTLSTGTQAQGYKNFSVEATSTLATAGGSASFTLNDGALFQIGANGLQQVGLTIDATSATDLGRNVSTSLTSLDDLTSNHKGALTNGLSSEALKVIDAAINQITNLRGSLGAFQSNTLQSGLNSLQVSQQNLTAAESTIRDVDFAAESASFTKNQILVQASTSMLAQANQLPQSVLKLLG
jgi:flagellin